MAELPPTEKRRDARERSSTPWHVSPESGDDRGLAFVVSDDGEIVASFGTLADADLCAAGPEMEAALEAVLLFYRAPWDRATADRWEALTGGREATTKALCDAVRRALAKAQRRPEPGDQHDG